MSHLLHQDNMVKAVTRVLCRRTVLLVIISVLTTGTLITACDTGPAPSLYNPDRPSKADPVISSVEPSGSALAGVDIVTISGENFSSNLTENLVYFDNTRADVLEAGPTQLRVRAPNTPSAELQIRVAILGAENYSNSRSYRLDSAAEQFGSITSFEEPFALASDASGNLYVSLNSDNRSVGIVRMTPDGTRSSYIETTFKWDSMAFGSDGLLYTVRSVRAIFRFAEGGSQQVWAVLPDNSARLTAISFDDQGNLWAGGNNQNLYRVTPDKTILAFPFEANIRALAVFGSYLYAAATQDDASKIWRFQLSPVGIGTAEEYYDVTGNFGAEAFALAFTTTGELFIGTDATDPVIVVFPDRLGQALYPGVLHPAAVSFAWGNTPSLYMTQGKTDTTTPNLIRINTRREGAR
ncbi:MAG: hypothetical protein BMS9Abin05_0797 [Rhodothermia bacterium]|nr:MAG: hypothetical protein BMS9Abin05_0797 [Rhodothermia bacterium]